MGKSRLVGGIAARIVNATVLRFQAAEDAVEVPFSGLVRALAPVRRTPDWPSLVEGLPRLHALWPGGVAPSAATADPELERASLVYAVVELLRRLARRGAVVLLLDDVQWVDRATIDVLRHLAPVAEDHPVLVLATARSDLLGPETGDPVGRREARGRPGCHAWPRPVRLELTRLSDDLTDAMVRDLLGEEPPRSSRGWCATTRPASRCTSGP